MNNETGVRPVKRIEMVLQQDVFGQIAEKLDALGISGYTMVEDVRGRGERGLRSGISLGVFQYHYLLIACEAEQVGLITEMVRPYLKRFGGMCMVSDAEWVIH